MSGFSLDEDDELVGADIRTVSMAPELVGDRIDKALAASLPELSRARLQALIAGGRVTVGGAALTDASAKARSDAVYQIILPPPLPALPSPEDIPLRVLFEDAHLIVVDKPAGMTVHPAPGNEAGTLVNALLHHCGPSLAGIGGVARPGIVHRLDKDTSGVMVAAKSDAAHQGLSKLFATHDIDRAYVALTRGSPPGPRGTITGNLGRSSSDRKKIAILKSGGREAVTHYAVELTFGPATRPWAAKVALRLETGRTHQIRVHLASKGAPVLGDALYGGGQPALPVRAAIIEAGLHRQALHAALLGFKHPVTGERLTFETPLPPDMAALQARLLTL